MGLFDRFRKIDKKLVDEFTNYQLIFELGTIINKAEAHIGERIPRYVMMSGRPLEPSTLEGWVKGCADADPAQINESLSAWASATDYNSKLDYLRNRVPRFNDLSRLASRNKLVLDTVTSTLESLTESPIYHINHVINEYNKKEPLNDWDFKYKMYEGLSCLLFWIGEQKGAMDAVPSLETMVISTLQAMSGAIEELQDKLRELRDK